jgi:hypothetical protein
MHFPDFFVTLGPMNIQPAFDRAKTIARARRFAPLVLLAALMPVLSAEHYAGDGRISPVAGGQAQGAELAF